MSKEVKNVLEYWPLYDSFWISFQLAQFYPDAGWLRAYFQLANFGKIQFFNTRTRSEVGLAYNNFDTKKHLPFAYHVHSIGIEICFIVSMMHSDFETKSHIIGVNDLDFANIVANHSSFSFYVGRDEKLVSATSLLPAGMGTAGDMDDAGTTLHVHNWVNVQNNGIVSLTNRYEFPEPILIPRNELIRGELDFSNYALESFAKMPEGPFWQKTAPPPVRFVDHSTPVGIRASLYGVREVQQRGQLHFD
jgi:hypothetical protein